jgi:hypothetical protein
MCAGVFSGQPHVKHWCVHAGPGEAQQELQSD